MTGNHIRSTYHCVIELLTPLHIGSGDAYIENFDFFHEGNGLFVFDRERLLAIVAAAGEKTIDSFTRAVEDGELGRWLKKNKIDMKQTLRHTLPCKKSPRDIKVQLRDGTGHPLLAGSSLKGAFRTAILARMSEQEGRKDVTKTIKGLSGDNYINLKFADSRICRNLLGKDAQNNLMRSLSVTDATFEKNCVRVQKVEISRLVHKSTMKDKPFSLYVEKIPQGSEAFNQVSFDDFLAKKGPTYLGFRTSLSLDWLLDAVRRKTEKTIETELDFLQNSDGDHVQDIRVFYEELRKKVGLLGKYEVILQLSWGSGWNGMTGQLLEKKELTPQLRSKLKLAPKYKEFPFPKSRRIAVTDDMTVPMGWVRLQFTGKEEYQKQAAIRLAEKKKQGKARQAEKEKERREKQAWDALSKQEQELAIVRGDAIAKNQAPGKQPMKDIWPELENAEPEHQKNLARAFYVIWQERPERWRKKECSPGQWKKVEQVVELLECTHPDILQVTAEDRELLQIIESLADWGQFKNAGINFPDLSLHTAELLAQRFQDDWGCANKKAKRDKKEAWKELKKQLSYLRKESAVTESSRNG